MSLPGGEAVRAAQQEVARLVDSGLAQLLNYPTESRFLTLRGAREAVIAPLAVEGEIVGAIAAYDRLGEVRGFADSDVNLLETVANHASMALHNESLIARLRHDAMHDTLTGLPEPCATHDVGDSGCRAGCVRSKSRCHVDP